MLNSLAQNNIDTSDTKIRLITLNIWGGCVLEPLLNFIKIHQNTEIFCLQEVYSQAIGQTVHELDDLKCYDIQEKISKILSEHHVYFRPVLNGVYGISTFIHKKIKVLDDGELNIYDNPSYSGEGPGHSRILQWLRIFDGHKKLTVINVHGKWNGKGKTDSPARIEQSRKIKTFINSVDTPVILCGDFNILPNTNSMAILAEGMQDFNKLYNVLSTRSSFYKKSERHADYILASPDITVSKFAVLTDEVSDHLPLYVEII